MKLFISLLVLFSCAGAQQKMFLSNLSADKRSPLYTTYAAAMERSEFTLDEGYHFLFYDSARGAEFTTDNAGDWALAFRKDGKYVYALNEMAQEPVVTVSYPDFVRYHFYPFDKLRADVSFLTYSSRIAIQDIVVTNEHSAKVSFDLLPFFQHHDRAFKNVRFMKDRNAVSFTHEEFPDDWVTSHNVPYVDNVDDVVLYSAAPERMSSFRSYKWGTVEIPQEIDLKKPPVYIVWGRITHGEMERCTHRSDVTMTVWLKKDGKKLLIENAPRWGSAESNINAYALYGIELGNLGPVNHGDEFTIVLSCNAKHQEVVLNGAVDTAKGGNVRIDAHLTDARLPKPVQGVKRDIWGSGTELRLYWKGEPGMKYNVYRRDYRKGGAYEMLAEQTERNFFTDKNIPDDRIYGYVVTAVDAQGMMSSHSNEVNNIEGSDFLTDVKYPGQVKGDAADLSRVISASKRFDLAPGESAHFRILRGVKRPDEDRSALMTTMQRLLTEDLAPYVAANEKLFSSIPVPTFSDPDQTMLYWTSFAMMRQVMLPPEGKSSFNYYVFSREPQWGWGHGGQVFHESLSMLAYVLMDKSSAMNSQRVYRERQRKDGYINYRTGSFLDENIPENNQLTTSAPWYAWQNWEVYKISKDKKFLDEMYGSSRAFYDYYVKNRDSDGDGLCEWGGEAVLESVRDARVAVWDEVGYPSNFDAVDLNSMLVKEERSLAAMAAELGRNKEAKAWTRKAEERSKKINAVMWDDSTGFYYNVDKKTNGFTFKKHNDLKRQEIIGFLPMWAGIADKKQTDRLMEKLMDPKKFWRKYGVPSLSADDSYYNPKGYWNGPVWVEWDYFIVRGLLDYGYTKEAKELTSRVAANMAAELKKNHNLWEFYSPDDQWAGYHKTYIWAGLISRMLLDVAGSK
jgi:hypothetical protein